MLAAGAPTDKPLVYAGVLEKNGTTAPDGNYDLTLDVWGTATAGAILCETVANGTAVSNGHFEVTLDPKCAAQVAAKPDLWLEVKVGSESLGRKKINAVPYALEANHAIKSDQATAVGAYNEAAIKTLDNAVKAQPKFTTYQIENVPNIGLQFVDSSGNGYYLDVSSGKNNCEWPDVLPR